MHTSRIHINYPGSGRLSNVDDLASGKSNINELVDRYQLKSMKHKSLPQQSLFEAHATPKPPHPTTERVPVAKTVNIIVRKMVV